MLGSLNAGSSVYRRLAYVRDDESFLPLASPVACPNPTYGTDLHCLTCHASLDPMEEFESHITLLYWVNNE